MSKIERYLISEREASAVHPTWPRSNVTRAWMYLTHDAHVLICSAR